MSYTYTRTAQFTDIPAQPGYRVRLTHRYQSPDPNRGGWLHVIAWRIFEATGNTQGMPIVVDGNGVYCLGLHDPGQFYEYALPGQEVD